MKLWILSLIFIFISGTSVQAKGPEELKVAPILKLGQAYGHHVLIAEKSTHQLHLFANRGGDIKHVKTYEVATGKKAGNKFFQGDHRTPEGIYQFTDFLNHQDLVKRHGIEQGSIYGVGAFVMNYPNPIDRLNNKTGGGIWLHSTNDEPRIDNGLDSRGCIVSTNSDLIELSQYLELNRSHVIVVQDLQYLTKKAWTTKKEKLNQTLESWLTSWKELDTKTYLSHYDSEYFYDPVRGNFEAFKKYKTNVFSYSKKPEITIDNVTILNSGEYVTATFSQHYKSTTLEDTGKKTLYLKKDEYYNWKIVAEVWSKSGAPQKVEKEDEKIAFTPKLRFFETQDPTKILPITPRQSDLQ